MVDEKIITRIKRLLAMSEDMTSEHEAAIATKRLHALLAKYNISLTDIENAADDCGEDAFECTNWPWKRVITSSIARLYFCSMYYQKSRKNYAKYFVVGSDINRTTAVHIIERVIQSLEKEARTQSRLVHGKLNSSFITSFGVGASKRIAERCHIMIEQSKRGELKDGEGNTLPVLASIYDQWDSKIDNYLNKHHNLRQRSTRLKTSDMHGRLAGANAGDRVSLNTSLHAQSAPKLLR